MSMLPAASGVIYWFRQDLRLHDQPALQQAVKYALDHRVWWLPVYIADADQDSQTAWDFVRVGPRRQAWTTMALQGLSEQLVELGSQLLTFKGQPVEILAGLSQSLQQPLLVCEEICAPYEALQIQKLQERGVRVPTIWQSTLMAPESLPFAHVADYCCRGLPSAYKTTRNELMGVDYSTKWSPWLATGALSPRQAWSAIAAFEQTQGANESTYWIGFELLWRDHFRWLHRKHGVRLYRSQGLTDLPAPAHHPRAFQQWCQGETGQPFIDAAMRELALTGYLSNRMRQNVASYLMHDLQCDWRAGAAWFESQLIDFDVYSNQGNWLYLAGRGTDPRGSRRFNTAKQAGDYDPTGIYTDLWR